MSWRAYPIDLTGAGNLWQSLRAFWEHQHKDRSVVCNPVTIRATGTPDANLEQLLEASLAKTAAARAIATADDPLAAMLTSPHPTLPGSGGVDEAPSPQAQQGTDLPEAPAPVDPAHLAQLVAWLRDRATAVVDAGRADLLAARWPADVPKLSAITTAAEVDAVDQVLVRLHAELQLPFSDPRPVPPTVDQAEPTPASPTASDPTAEAAELLAEWQPDDIKAAFIRLAAPRARTLDHRFDRDEVDRLADLIDGMERLVLELSFDAETGRPSIVTSAPQAAVELLDIHGSKRAVVAAAKTACVGAFRSFDDVLAQPHAVARLTRRGDT